MFKLRISLVISTILIYVHCSHKKSYRKRLESIKICRFDHARVLDFSYEELSKGFRCTYRSNQRSITEEWIRVGFSLKHLGPIHKHILGHFNFNSTVTIFFANFFCLFKGHFCLFAGPFCLFKGHFRLFKGHFWLRKSHSVII